MLQLMQNALIGGIFFFVTFCDDSIKNSLHGKLYLGLKAGTTELASDPRREKTGLRVFRSGGQHSHTR